MIKKSELRSEFERIVTSVKSAVFVGFSEPIKTFRLDIVPCSLSTWQITLWAISERVDDTYGLPYVVCLSRSYPFRSYKSAYQALVRL